MNSGDETKDPRGDVHTWRGKNEKTEMATEDRALSWEIKRLKQGRDLDDHSDEKGLMSRKTLTDSLTFSFSPENKSPERGDHLKLVSVSPHLPDGAGQDQTFGIHLLKKRNISSNKHTTNTQTLLLH